MVNPLRIQQAKDLIAARGGDPLEAATELLAIMFSIYEPYHDHPMLYAKRELTDLVVGRDPKKGIKP